MTEDRYNLYGKLLTIARTLCDIKPTCPGREMPPSEARRTVDYLDRRLGEMAHKVRVVADSLGDERGAEVLRSEVVDRGTDHATVKLWYEPVRKGSVNDIFIADALRKYAAALESGELDGAGHYLPENLNAEADMLEEAARTADSKPPARDGVEVPHDDGVWDTVKGMDKEKAAHTLLDMALAGNESDKRFCNFAKKLYGIIRDEGPTASGVPYDRVPHKCPTCGSPSPEKHPAVQFEGEVIPCRDPWHQRHPGDLGQQTAESVLRSLASWLGVGGYNADRVDPATFEAKIREGVESAIRVEKQRASGVPYVPEEVRRLPDEFRTDEDLTAFMSAEDAANECAARIERALASAPAVPGSKYGEHSADVAADSNWSAGARFGWNCAIAGDKERLEKAIQSRIDERAQIAAAPSDGGGG